jgi:hypothetical protein
MKALGIVFILIIVLLALVSAKTVIPESGGMRNLVGYTTCCPFAPASTAIGVALVVILLWAAKSMALF